MELRDELVQDRRALELRNAGIIVEHSISGVGGDPVEFQIVDPFPSNFEVDDIGFHPNHKPESGRIGDDHAVISGNVEPGDTAVYRYGIRISAGSSTEAIAEAQAGSLPSIELSEAVGQEMETEHNLEEAALTRSASGTTSNPSPGDGFLETMGWASPTKSEETGEVHASVEGQESGAEVSAENSQMSATEAESASEGSPFSWQTIGSITGREASDEGEEVEDGSSDEWTDPPEREARLEEADEAVDIRDQGDPSGESETDPWLPGSRAHEASEGDDPHTQSEESGREAESRDADQLDHDDDKSPGDETDERTARSDGSPRTSVDAERTDDPVEALIRQLEAREYSNEQARRLSDEIKPLLDEGDTVSESFKLRLERLETRIQTFEAYADALDAIIDEHGPADEFLGQVRDDIRSMRSEVDRIEHQLDAATEDRNHIDDRLDSLDELANLLDARTDHLGDRMESIRSNHRSKLSSLEDDIERLEPVAEQVEELRQQVEELRDDVSAAEARRRAMIEALSGRDTES